MQIDITIADETEQNAIQILNDETNCDISLKRWMNCETIPKARDKGKIPQGNG